VLSDKQTTPVQSNKTQVLNCPHMRATCFGLYLGHPPAYQYKTTHINEEYKSIYIAAAQEGLRTGRNMQYKHIQGNTGSSESCCPLRKGVPSDELDVHGSVHYLI